MARTMAVSVVAVSLSLAPGCSKSSAGETGEEAVSAKPVEAAQAAPAEIEVAARTPTKGRRMAAPEPLARCEAAGTWKIQVSWKGKGRCKGVPDDRKSFDFNVADVDGLYEASLDWSNYEPSALDVNVDGDECLIDLQADSMQLPGAGLIFNMTEKNGLVTGEGMYEAPIDLDSGKTCTREFTVVGKLSRADR